VVVWVWSDGGGRKATQGCPCGYLGSADYQCRCGSLQVERYLAKISGPLLDRISIHVTVRPVDVEALRDFRGGESSGSMRAQAVRAREIQMRRFESGAAEVCNAVIPESVFRQFCRMDDDAEELLYGAQKRLRISARGRAHVVRVARTIADLEGAGDITVEHIAEAI
jgi:magnesium chelatase family protein